MKKTGNFKAAAIGAAVLAFAFAGAVQAGSITGGGVTGGSALTAGATFVDLSVPWGNVTTPDNTLGDANMNGSPNLFAFAESQDVTLSSGLTTQVGTTPVPAGTTVDSFYVTFEPGGGGLQLIGYVDFSEPVLAIITADASLSASNFLGAPGITYLDPVDVGLEAGDLVTIDSANPNQIDWNTSASTPGDSVRVILGTAAVPEPAGQIPAGIVLLMLGAGVAGKRKLRAR